MKKHTNDQTPLHIAQHHAATDMKTGRQIGRLFSSSTNVFSIDALQNTRVNSDKNNKRHVLQVDTPGSIRGFDQTRQREAAESELKTNSYVDHAANAVATHAKLSLFAVYLYETPAKKSQVLVPSCMYDGSLKGGPPESGWEESNGLGYVETFHPETAARNFTSLLEVVESGP